MFQLIFKVFQQQQQLSESERERERSNHILRYDGRCQQTNKWQAAKGKFFIVLWLVEETKKREREWGRERWGRSSRWSRRRSG